MSSGDGSIDHSGHWASRTGGASQKEILMMDVDETILAPDALVAVGVGYAAVTCDGVPRYEAEYGDLEHAMSVRDAETMAAAEPQHDWRIHLVGPLDERHYRRSADGRWKIYRRGYGLS
jgi:hypothetical protein